MNHTIKNSIDFQFNDIIDSHNDKDMCLTRYGKLHYEAIKDKSTNVISIVSITSELQDHIDDKYNPINNISYNITNDDNDIDDTDDSVPVIDIEPIRVENMNTKWCQDIEKVFISTAQKHNMYITKLRWFATRVEIVLSTTSDNNPDSVQPSADVLTKIHQEIYNELDAREEELQFISRYELLVATPGTHLYTHSFIHNHSINHSHLLAQLGIGEYLTTDRDFITFKGFPVTVTTSEEYKKKINFDGNVIGRDDTHVILSLKGRLIKIPRGIVASVKLPKSQHESTDYEMQKLK
jgi:ribosome maturation factor RimP